MQTMDIRDEQGRLRSFEISSWMGRRRIAKVIGNIANAHVIKTTSGFTWNLIVPNRDELVCMFELAGIRFKVTEDYGDSDRYWIGPEDHEIHPETEMIRQVFANLP